MYAYFCYNTILEIFLHITYLVRRVENPIGPQTRPDYTQTLDKLMSNKEAQHLNGGLPIKQERLDSGSVKQESTDNISLSAAIEERFHNIEQHLNMQKLLNPKNIHHRLKAIENRILHLESISPEYKHFVVINAIMCSEVVNSFSFSKQFDGNSGNLRRIESDRNSMQSKQNKFKIYTVEDLDNIIGQMQRQQQQQLKTVVESDEDFMETAKVKTEVLSS